MDNFQYYCLEFWANTFCMSIDNFQLVFFVIFPFLLIIAGGVMTIIACKTNNGKLKKRLLTVSIMVLCLCVVLSALYFFLPFMNIMISNRG